MTGELQKISDDKYSLDCIGLKCPRPVLKLTMVVQKITKGSILEITGDCPTFENDLRDWSEISHHLLLSVKDEGNNVKRIQVQF